MNIISWESGGERREQIIEMNIVIIWIVDIEIDKIISKFI